MRHNLGRRESCYIVTKWYIGRGQRKCHFTLLNISLLEAMCENTKPAEFGKLNADFKKIVIGICLPLFEIGDLLLLRLSIAAIST